MKQIETHIMGQSYRLGCPEGGEAQLLAAVAKLDAAMCKIRDGGRVKARDRIAVLAALNLAFELTTPPSAPQPSATSPTAGRPLPERLAALSIRLDEALAQDGRLL